MKSAVLFTFCCLLTTVEGRERPVRPARPHIDLEHLAGGVQFKIKREDRQSLRGESEHDRISRIVETVGRAVEHLTGGFKPERVFRHAGINEQKQMDAGLHLWYRFNTAARSDGEPELASQKRAADAVAYLTNHRTLTTELQLVEAELKIKQTYSTDDPSLATQVTYHYDVVNLAAAWEYTGGDPDVVVQVIDTGIDMDHPDLLVNQWGNSGETDCTDGVDNDGNGFIDDCRGYNHADDTGTELEGDGSHGTHCAGTIAADNDNGVGVAGIAGGKGGAAGASLMINTCFGSTATGGFAEALVYGADNGAHISSNSWAYTVAGAYDSSVLDAIDYADNAGVIVVFAAGNDGTDDTWYPAYYSTTIAVAAVDKDKTAAYFTNYGDWIDISAPGYPVYSTVTVADGSYGYKSGTSMACPHVAGGLALAKSYMPSATAAEIVACLFSSALDIDSDNTATYTNNLGAGLMDIVAMIECLGTQSPTISPAPSARPIPSPTMSPVIPPTQSPVFAPTVGPKSTSTCDDLGWTNAEDYGDDGVCGQSIINGKCGTKKTFAQAEAFCESVGARLCTRAELLDDEARGTNCGMDTKDVWSSTPCSGGYYLMKGSTAKPSGNKCISANKKSNARCCADTTLVPVPAPTAAPVGPPVIAPTKAPSTDAVSASSCDDLGWTNAADYGDSDICGNSVNNKNKCSGKKNFNGAKTFCESFGARLCTLDELLDDNTKGTSCALDTKRVWSSTVCDGGYYVASGSTVKDLTSCKKGNTKNIYARCCANA